MSDRQNNQICPKCGAPSLKSQSQCMMCGHKFSDTHAYQNPNLVSFENISFLDKNPWLIYLGLFLIVAIIFGFIILASGEMITNSRKYFVEIFWLTQAISGGVIALLVGCVQLFIFRKDLKKKFYIPFLLSSLLSGVIAGGLVGYFFHLQVLSYSTSSSFAVGMTMGAISGCLSSIAQGLFIFSRQSQGFTKTLIKWVAYHIISWAIIWGVGWVISWRSSTTESLAIAFVAIMVMSGVLFTAFIEWVGNIDYAA